MSILSFAWILLAYWVILPGALLVIPVFLVIYVFKSKGRKELVFRGLAFLTYMSLITLTLYIFLH